MHRLELLSLEGTPVGGLEALEDLRRLLVGSGLLPGALDALLRRRRRLVPVLDWEPPRS